MSNLRWLHKCSHTTCSVTEGSSMHATNSHKARLVVELIFTFSHSKALLLQLNVGPATLSFTRVSLNSVFQRMEHLIFFLPPFLSFLPPPSGPTSFFRARISRIRSKKTCVKHSSVLEEFHHSSDLVNLQLRAPRKTHTLVP